MTNLPRPGFRPGRDRFHDIQRPSEYRNKKGATAMTTTTTTTSNAHLEFIGMIVEIAGVAAVVGGLVLSLHHWPAAAALIGGGVAFYIGKKLRAM
jgi:hypothetical protein